MTNNEIITAIYDAVEHAVCAGDFSVDCMSLGATGIYLCIDNKNYILTIKGYK